MASQETPSGLLDDKSKGSLAGGRGFYWMGGLYFIWERNMNTSFISTIAKSIK